MIETPFFFQNGSYNLFGILHEPENNTRDAGFVFCAPFAEEKLWTHRVFVNFARELANRGYSVLRFDFMGHGDSDGNFEDSTIETRLSDIKCALQTLKEKVPLIKETSILGLRFGATLALITAENVPDIRKLILWDPIIDGSRYMQEILRINLTTQTAIYKEIRNTREDMVQMMKEGQTVNIDGYELSYDLFQQASNLNLLNGEVNFPGDCLLVQISRKEQNFKKDLEKLRELYSECDLILSIEEPFWKEIKLYYSKAKNLFHDTLEWLDAK